MYAHPTPEQLTKIHRFSPANTQPFEAEELAVFEFIATDNLVNRGLGKWGIEELPVLAEFLPGLPFTLNHDWDLVEKVQGLVFDAEVRKYDFSSISEWVLQGSNNAEYDKEIILEEGYNTLIAFVAFDLTSPVLSKMRLGSVGKVSLGGFAYKSHVCPNCNIVFDDERCPHGMPDPYWGMTIKRNPMIAPYYIRSGVYDLGELSAVLIPNIRHAGLVTTYKKL